MKTMKAAIAAALIVVGLAGCSQAVPFTAPTSAAIFSPTTCYPRLGALQDVAPPRRHLDRLLDPHLHPATALICEYGSVFGQGPGPRHSLVKQISLSGASARSLAAAAARIDVGTSSGRASCPDDTGNVTVMAFSYPHSQPVDLWWHSTGCQTIDNGAINAGQVSNDSFGHFQTVFTQATRTDD